MIRKLIITYKTKLKLDKEVGGGDFSELRYLFKYPYAWTVNFEICIDVQLRTYQPPISKASLTSAWCYKYIGRWIKKSEGSAIGFGRNFKGWMADKFPEQKWLISNVWEHFLVPEHRMPIRLVFGSIRKHRNMKNINISLDVLQFLKLTWRCNSWNPYNSRLKWRFTWTKESMSTTKPL